MDKRKLIGTIIGVIMFALLIAGATYAFLTFTANVTGGTYNGTTMNFLVDYLGGNTIGTMPQLVTATPDTAASLHVYAAKHAGSVDGYLTIKLTTTSTDSLTTDGVVNWVICKGECEGSFNHANKKAEGTITSSGELTLWKETTEVISETGDTYYIYFWIDAATINNSHLGLSYSGYIHASAAQIET